VVNCVGVAGFISTSPFQVNVRHGSLSRMIGPIRGLWEKVRRVEMSQQLLRYEPLQQFQDH